MLIQNIFYTIQKLSVNLILKKVIPGEIVSMTVAPKEGEEGKTVCKNVCGLFGTNLLIDSDQYTYRIRSKGK